MDKTRGSSSYFVVDKLITVLWIVLFWLLLAFYQYFDRYAILLDYEVIDEGYTHSPFIIGIFVSITLGGLFGGTALVFLWEKWLRNMAFFRALLYMFTWYTVLYLLITFVSLITYQGDDSPLAAGPFTEVILPALFNIHLLPNYFFWLGVMLVTITFLLVRDKFGPGMFLSFLRGKYFRPKKEDRVFMFMDMKSSTTIAENLGEETYFNFLNDTFKTATPAILDTQGEIYQYVGDEIVVSWPVKSGIVDLQCIACFKQMKALLQKKGAYFEATYGVTPVFKAGLHHGSVIAGEIGIIKREIVYTGDVLNTTARIQSKCNELGVDILVSAQLVQASTNTEMYAFRSLGTLELRGKSEPLEVMTIA